MEAASRLAERIDQLAEAGQSLWARYQVVGPGKVDAAYFDAVQAAAEQLEAVLIETEPPHGLQDLHDCSARLRDLSRRCACMPQGLSFITGEAGLIPRRDQHEAMEQALRELRQAAVSLRK